MVPFVALLPLTSGLSIEMNYTFADTSDLNHSFVQNITVMTPEQETSRGAMMALVGFLFGMTSLVSVTTFATSFMLINNSCSNDDRGAVNGLAMTVASLTKAMGPVIGSSILAWSFQHGRHAGWFFGHTFNFWCVASLWLLLGYVASKVLFRYKLDVHFQNHGNEVNFQNILGSAGEKDGGKGGGNDRNDGNRNDASAELDEAIDGEDAWADI
jgi:MFS family permease